MVSRVRVRFMVRVRVGIRVRVRFRVGIRARVSIKTVSDLWFYERVATPYWTF